MASAILVHTQWSPPPLQCNRGRQASVLTHKSITLSSASQRLPVTFQRSILPPRCYGFPVGAQKRGNGGAAATPGENQLTRIALQSSLWISEIAYILWLFLLPYAPGDPVWAIKSNTINDLVAEGLFNFVIGWTFLFAPLLFTDRHRGRFKGSLDLLWGFQMFLTNTFLIPYMAIRLNKISDDVDQSPPKPSQLGLLMTNGAGAVGLVGGIVCFVSIIWALFGRVDGGFGDLADRWRFLELYIRSERLAYAFIWDIFFYAVFQVWLIGENLQNVKVIDEKLVSVLRYMPVLGLVAYLLCLDGDSDL